jgi:hypothetical protein
MAPRVARRSRCSVCEAELVHLAGDPSVGYEDIDPLEGGPRTLVEHDRKRCDLHVFLTPAPGRHTLPGNADWATGNPLPTGRIRRWQRDD